MSWGLKQQRRWKAYGRYHSPIPQIEQPQFRLGSTPTTTRHHGGDNNNRPSILSLVDRVTDFFFGTPEDAAPKDPKSANFQRQRNVDMTKKYKKAEQSEIEKYQLTLANVLKAKIWTYKEFRRYYWKTFALMGIFSVKSELSKKLTADPMHLELMKSLRILDAMTPDELERTSHRDFTFKDRLLIAEAAKVSPEDVLQLFIQFDTLKYERRWFLHRVELGLPLPQTVADKELLMLTDKAFKFPKEWNRYHGLMPFYQFKQCTSQNTEIPWFKQQCGIEARKKFPGRQTTGFDRWACGPHHKTSMYYNKSIMSSKTCDIKRNRLADNVPRIKYPVTPQNTPQCRDVKTGEKYVSKKEEMTSIGTVYGLPTGATYALSKNVLLRKKEREEGSLWYEWSFQPPAHRNLIFAHPLKNVPAGKFKAVKLCQITSQSQFFKYIAVYLREVAPYLSEIKILSPAGSSSCDYPFLLASHQPGNNIIGNRVLRFESDNVTLTTEGTDGIAVLPRSDQLMTKRNLTLEEFIEIANEADGVVIQIDASGKQPAMCIE